MSKISNPVVSDTFSTWLTAANKSYSRLNQFAVSESALYANTITANVSLVMSGGATFKGQALDSRFANTVNLNLKQSVAVERAALANTNTYIATKASQADHLAALANTNSYIASMSTDVQLANTNLAISNLNTNLLATNTAIRLLSNQGLANTNAAIGNLNTNLLATNTAIRLLNTNTQSALDTQEALEATHLANTNSYIATKQTIAQSKSYLANTNLAIGNLNTNLLATNTAIRLLNTNTQSALDTQEAKQASNLANTNAYIAATATTASAALPKAGGAMTGAITGITHANGVIFTSATASGATTLDFASHTHFHLILTGNLTLSNPSTEVSGSSGLIFLKQDGSGSRTLSLGTDFEKAGGGGFTLSTAAGATDVIPYYVVSPGRILLGSIQRAMA